MSDGSDSDYSPLPEDIINIADFYYPSDDVLISNGAEKSTEWPVMHKAKEITLKTIIFKQSSFRIKFDLWGGDPTHLVSAQIYKNGTAIGTLWTRNSKSYATFIDNFEGPWEQNDTIELWATRGTSDEARVQNFNICGTKNVFKNTLT